MASLSFPDINVWLALTSPEHPHTRKLSWWNRESGDIAFCRQSQLGFLRLTTTAMVMSGKPLTMAEAWSVYDRFYEDGRVRFVQEPGAVERLFRERTSGSTASPKMWSDAWLLATATAADGRLVTFDAALGQRGAHCLSAT